MVRLILKIILEVMKFVKDIKNFVLDRKLKSYKIIDYTINEDGSIDCNQDVRLSSRDLIEIPLKFNNVNGHFNIVFNKLKTLKNCPKYIGGYFDCTLNDLTSLEYGPEYVGSSYLCDNNRLETLKGCVDEVYGRFSCQSNQLISLEFCPMQVEGHFDCSNNKLVELDRSPFIRRNLYCKRMFKSEPIFNGSCQNLIWKE